VNDNGCSRIGFIPVCMCSGSLINETYDIGFVMIFPLVGSRAKTERYKSRVLNRKRFYFVMYRACRSLFNSAFESKGGGDPARLVEL
jgi:hypothetical protein